MQCYACQAPLKTASRFCPSCGRPILLNDRYRVTRLLGQGGFAVVYEAEDMRLLRPCAIKVVAAGTPDEQRQAEAEARILGSNAAAMPFIPDVYDIWSLGGQIYLAMQYIEGQSLDALPVPWAASEVEGFLRTMLGHLEQIHAAGIVHRDIKPANIRRVPRGGYVLLDFGIAKQGGATMRIARAASLDFAPLEQLRGQPTDPRSDLYGLGATGYFLATGRPPARPDARLLQAEPLEPPGRLAPGLPPALEAALLAMLALDPADRPASAQAALTMLSGPAASSAGEVTTRLSGPAASSAGAPTTRLGSAPPVAAEQVIVVAQDGSGDYEQIRPAIAAALPGARILIRPGRYEEAIRLDRNVDLVGDGPREAIVVAASEADALYIDCEEATIRGLTLRTLTGDADKKCFGVDVPKGRVLIEDCDISSNSLACVGVHNSAAAPTFRRCAVHSGKQGGFYFYAGAAGLVEECDIHGNTFSGVEFHGGANPTVRRCTIRDGKQSGVMVQANAEGVIEECEISGNAFNNIVVKEGGHPTVVRCRISDAGESGVFVHSHGVGLFEECDIWGSRLANISISASDPTVRRCTIRDGKQSGVYAYEQANGLIEGCEIYGNTLAGVAIAEGAATLVRDCRLRDGKGSGFSFYDRSAGSVEGCEVYGNTLAGLMIYREANPSIRRSRFHSGVEGGALVYQDGQGLIEECEFFGNTFSGFEIREGGVPTLRRCRLYDNRTVGLLVAQGGTGRVEGCEIAGNVNGGVLVRREGNPVVRGCLIKANRQNGVSVETQASGVFEECEVVENQLAGFELNNPGGTRIARCQVNRNRAQAVYAHSGGEAQVSDCDLSENRRGAFLIMRGAAVTRSGNRER